MGASSWPVGLAFLLARLRSFFTGVEEGSLVKVEDADELGSGVLLLEVIMAVKKECEVAFLIAQLQFMPLSWMHFIGTVTV
jgi:hypothetical protein